MSNCPKCFRPMNMGNSPNPQECTETDDDEGLCEAYAKLKEAREGFDDMCDMLDRIAHMVNRESGEAVDEAVARFVEHYDALEKARDKNYRSALAAFAERDKLLNALQGLLYIEPLKITQAADSARWMQRVNYAWEQARTAVVESVSRPIKMHHPMPECTGPVWCSCGED